MIIPLFSLTQKYPHDYPFKELFKFISDSGVEVMIAGGFVSRLLTGRDLLDGDVDCYTRSSNDHAKFNDYLSEYAGGEKVAYNSTNATSYESILIGEDHYVSIQLVERTFDSPMSIFESFDMTVCQGALDVFNRVVICTDNFFWDNKTMTLRPSKPGGDVKADRLKKYRGFGYKDHDPKDIIYEPSLIAGEAQLPTRW